MQDEEIKHQHYISTLNERPSWRLRLSMKAFYLLLAEWPLGHLVCGFFGRFLHGNG